MFSLATSSIYPAVAGLQQDRIPDSRCPDWLEWASDPCPNSSSLSKIGLKHRHLAYLVPPKSKPGLWGRGEKSCGKMFYPLKSHVSLSSLHTSQFVFLHISPVTRSTSELYSLKPDRFPERLNPWSAFPPQLPSIPLLLGQVQDQSTSR